MIRCLLLQVSALPGRRLQHAHFVPPTMNLRPPRRMGWLDKWISLAGWESAVSTTRERWNGCERSLLAHPWSSQNLQRMERTAVTTLQLTDADGTGAGPQSEQAEGVWLGMPGSWFSNCLAGVFPLP